MRLRFPRTALALLVMSPALVAAFAAATGCGAQTGSAAPGVDASMDGAQADQRASDTATGSADTSERTDAGPDASDGGSDAGQDVSFDNNPGCPAAYGSAGGCGPIGLVCHYPQGQCNCMVPCSGVALPPDASAWSCTFNAGCPDTLPTTGSACSQAGQHCAYPGCCIPDDFTCVNGAWDAAPAFCPP
jgi:hypothetical protein